MPVDDIPFPRSAIGVPRRDSLLTALDRIAEESADLRVLAQRQHLAMLDYLLGMVVLEAEQLRQRAQTAQ